MSNLSNPLPKVSFLQKHKARRLIKSPEWPSATVAVWFAPTKSYHAGFSFGSAFLRASASASTRAPNCHCPLQFRGFSQNGKFKWHPPSIMACLEPRLLDLSSALSLPGLRSVSATPSVSPGWWLYFHEKKVWRNLELSFGKSVCRRKGALSFVFHWVIIKKWALVRKKNKTKNHRIKLLYVVNAQA